MNLNDTRYLPENLKQEIRHIVLRLESDLISVRVRVVRKDIWNTYTKRYPESFPFTIPEDLIIIYGSDLMYSVYDIVDAVFFPIYLIIARKIEFMRDLQSLVTRLTDFNLLVKPKNYIRQSEIETLREILKYLVKKETHYAILKLGKRLYDPKVDEAIVGAGTKLNSEYNIIATFNDKRILDVYPVP